MDARRTVDARSLDDSDQVDSQSAFNLPGLPAPMVSPAVGLATGIALGRSLNLPWPAVLVFLFLFAATVIVVSNRRPIPTFLFAILFLPLGVLLYLASMQRLPADHISRLLTDEPALTSLTGRVTGDPVHSERSQGVFARWKPRVDVTTFDVDLAEIAVEGSQWTDVSGRVRVRASEPVPELRVGDDVELTGWLYRPESPKNPGSFDSAERLRRMGILAGMKCTSRAAIVVVERSGGPSLLERMRRRAGVLLRGDLTGGTEEQNSYLDAMVLGRRTVVDRETNEKMVRIGCAHFLAASGMHVAVLALFFYWLCRLFGFGRFGGAASMLAVVTLYALLAEPRPPILRATIGVYVFGGAMLLGRPVSAWNKLAVAAVLILLWQPVALFDAGFQLSFAAVGGILLTTGPMSRWITRHVLRLNPEVERLKVLSPRREKWRRVRLRIVDVAVGMFAVSVSAWMWTWPLGAYHFQRVSWLGWLNSLMMTAVVTLTVVVGFLKVIVAAVLPGLGVLLTPLVAAASSWMSQLSAWLDAHVGGTFFVPAPIGASVLLIYAGMIVVLGRNWGWWRRMAAILLIVAGGGFWLLPRGTARADGSLRLTQLAVGQGTATVIEWPDGSTHLYDVGTDGSYDVGRSTVLPFLLHSGIDRIDRIWLSHANLDHFSGVLDVLDSVQCGPVVSTPYFDVDCGPGTPGNVLLDELEDRGRVVEIANAPEMFKFDGGGTLTILWPPDTQPFALSANDASLVARIEHRWYRVLLCGDIEAEAQAWLMDHADIEADVLVMPHHGSVRTNLAEFVAAVDPEYVVISGGRRRERLSPKLWAMLDGRAAFNTADDGAVVVSIVGEKLSVEAWARR